MSDERIAVVGLSHHTAPVEVRERFVYSDDEARQALHELVQSPGVREAVLLSTCNRTELYVHADAAAGPRDAQALLERRALELATPSSGWLYERSDLDAVRHLFRVVTSLDSMVLGEAQIQGQVRGAYESARQAPAGTAGPVLSRLFESALHLGGAVRSATALGAGAASVPSAAVQLAKKIFGSLEGRRALILGAGEMSELALECLRSEGARSLMVANRTEGRARALAERAGGSVIPFEELAAALRETDIVATATAAPHPMLTARLVREALPKGAHSPLCIIDMALPRDVEPEVADIGNVFLYDLDDLRQVVDDNLARRMGELSRVEGMIESAVGDYWHWYRGRRAGPVIRALRERAEQQRRADLDALFARLPHLSEADRAELEEATRRMVNRMLHEPTVRLRQAAANGKGSDVVQAARWLFALDEGEGGATAEGGADAGADTDTDGDAGR